MVTIPTVMYLPRLTILLFIITGCAIRQAQIFRTSKDLCSNITDINNIQLITKTRLVRNKEKLIFKQHIYIKDGFVRIDTIGVFDNIINSIIIKDDFYIIDYQQQIIYKFSSEEAFQHIFGFDIPISKLAFFLTLSDKKLSQCTNAENGLVKTCPEEKIIIRKDITDCNSLKVDFISTKYGNILAEYTDFSHIDGRNIFHRLKIKESNEKFFIDISVTKIRINEINKDIFELKDIRGFQNVSK